MGVLLPWTVLLHIQRSNPGKRVQMQSILLLIFVGSFTIGYLIRLIGGQVEQTLITVAFSLLCFLGLFMSFFDDTPERVILRNWNSLACGNRENLSTSMTDDLYASLLQSADDSGQLPSRPTRRTLPGGVLPFAFAASPPLPRHPRPLAPRRPLRLRTFFSPLLSRSSLSRSSSSRSLTPFATGSRSFRTPSSPTSSYWPSRSPLSLWDSSWR